ncbi:MAG: phosphoadenylyl-sulfate reductase [Corynebacterium sp.]|uniref:phosphoadenylyl-sulfate reductase n=1 Tax=unclassified Corynebacterium TaxID=2624378 RepID=UPI000961ABBD|nr:phosphoadenylyl-sulfate reductase [Corynebacterium sp. CNJ-954]OLT49985.1 phosphoadenosine phosphosulfate reductase [Corynebacterium sp. CNJ-954]
MTNTGPDVGFATLTGLIGASGVSGVSGTQDARDLTDPEVSPPDAPTTTTPLSEEQTAAHRALVDEWNGTLEGASAEEILDWVNEHVTGTVAVTMSMQDTVLAELTEGRVHDAEMVFLDTGYHFDETLDVARDVDERYTLPLRTVEPVYPVKKQDEVYGRDLYKRNPTACCRMRKVEPLARMLNPYEAWISGVKRVDSELRRDTPILDVDRTGRLKINPIAAWTEQDVEDYIHDHDLIIHPLTTQGYPSIGCATCTMPVAPGEDPRSGRWANSSKTECGLHL